MRWWYCAGKTGWIFMGICGRQHLGPIEDGWIRTVRKAEAQPSSLLEHWDLIFTNDPRILIDWVCQPCGEVVGVVNRSLRAHALAKDREHIHVAMKESRKPTTRR